MRQDEVAVKDASGLVHAMTGLRVCDAQVVPRLIGCDTNAPVIMKAEKTADSVRKDRYT